MAENFGKTPTFDGGYDGVSGFWLKLYGVSICDTSRMCLLVGYLGCMCLGFYCWHVATTGSFMLSRKGSVVDYLAGEDDDSGGGGPAAPIRRSTQSKPTSKNNAGKRTASVSWSGGVKPVDDDDEWIKME
jgi:hypothetical protein